MSTLLAPPSIYLGNEYVSPSMVGREQFMKIMSHGFSLDEEQVSMLESVYVDTKKWFEWKFRRTGSRYFEHPKAVALMGLLEFGNTSFEWAIARLGHDTSEDTFKGLSGMRANYGKRAAGIIGLVTNPIKTGNDEKDAMAKRAHYLTIRQFPEAGEVKVPDRVHNLRSHEVRLVADGVLGTEYLNEKTIENAKRQVQESIEYIIPIAECLGGKYYTILSKEIFALERAIENVRQL